MPFHKLELWERQKKLHEFYSLAVAKTLFLVVTAPGLLRTMSVIKSVYHLS